MYTDPVMLIIVGILVVFWLLAERSRTKEFRRKYEAQKRADRAHSKAYWNEWAEVHEGL